MKGSRSPVSKPFVASKHNIFQDLHVLHSFAQIWSDTFSKRERSIVNTPGSFLRSFVFCDLFFTFDVFRTDVEEKCLNCTNTFFITFQKSGLAFNFLRKHIISEMITYDFEKKLVSHDSILLRLESVVGAQLFFAEKE